jgi:hypothetical protein
MSKQWNKDTISGERLKIEISNAHQPDGTYVVKLCVLFMTSMNWSFFLNNKIIQDEIQLEFIKELRNKHQAPRIV